MSIELAREQYAQLEAELYQLVDGVREVRPDGRPNGTGDGCLALTLDHEPAAAILRIGQRLTTVLAAADLDDLDPEQFIESARYLTNAMGGVLYFTKITVAEEDDDDE